MKTEKIDGVEYIIMSDDEPLYRENDNLNEENIKKYRDMPLIELLKLLDEKEKNYIQQKN